MLTRIATDQGKLHSQLGRFSLLHRITRATGERHDLPSLYRAVLRQVEEDLPVEFAAMLVYEPGATSLTLAVLGSASTALAAALTLAEQQSVPIDQNGLARCVAGGSLRAGHACAPVPVPAALCERRVPRARDRAAPRGKEGLRCAGGSAARRQLLQQRRLRIPAPAERARGARLQPGTAVRQSAARLRRSAPVAAGHPATGAVARARRDGERHRPRHQQRHVAGGDLHLLAPRARSPT